MKHFSNNCYKISKWSKKNIQIYDLLGKIEYYLDNKKLQPSFKKDLISYEINKKIIIHWRVIYPVVERM